LFADLCWQFAEEMEALVQRKAQGDTMTNIRAGSPLASFIMLVGLCVCSTDGQAGKFVHSFRRFGIVYKMEMSGQPDAPTTLSSESDL